MPKRSASSSIPSPNKRSKALESLVGKIVANTDSVSLRSGNHPASDDHDGDIDAVEAPMEKLAADTPEGIRSRNVAASGVESAFFEFFRSVSERSNDLRRDHAQVMKEARELSSAVGEEEPAERKAVVDQFMRDFLLRRILTKSRTAWSQFLELAVALAKEDVCTPCVLFTLISDLFELSSLRECQQIFEFVEKHLDVWKEPLFLNSGKNAVLRMCNDLLRRLSRAQNTIFCGRILIFLSNYFPFSERSGLNIMSEFNSDNVTVYKTNDGTDDDPEDKMDIVEERNETLFEGMHIEIPGLENIIVLTQEEKKKRMKVDYNLYVKFWSLQDYFRRPLECYSKIAWKTFTLYINDVLTVFSFFKIDPAAVFKSKTLRKRRLVGADYLTPAAILPSDSAVNDIPRLTDESFYFAKYLTNRRLLELQMNDPSFRRHFLVQLLVILQYLTVNVKFKNEGHVLAEDQQEFVRKTSERVCQLLEEIPPSGSQFVQAVKHILTREQLWNQWKNDGCPAFKKPSLSSGIVTDCSSRLNEKVENDKVVVDDTTTDDKSLKSGAPKVAVKSKQMDQDDEISRDIEEGSKPMVMKRRRRRRLGSIIADAAENGRFLMGNSELTRLWNICGNNLEACRSKARDFSPPIDVFFAEAFKEVDLDTTTTAQDSKKEVQPKKILGNSNFGWRALRLLARKSPYFFQMFGGSPVQPLQNYLEFVLRKILAEKEVPVQPSTPERSERSQDSKEGEDEEEEETAERVGRGAKKRDEEQEAEMEREAEEDEMMNDEVRNDSEEDEEEGEVNERVRNLTDTEMKTLGKQLGPAWKKLALRLRFTADEVQYFEEATVKDPGSVGAYMLQRWTEQEGEEATVADLLYTLEGLGIKELADGIL